MSHDDALVDLRQSRRQLQWQPLDSDRRRAVAVCGAQHFCFRRVLPVSLSTPADVAKRQLVVEKVAFQRRNKDDNSD